ncbi:MAG: alpha-glucosidase/alpha-galactosidase, partial [Chloroflexi bacterium]|nr:alpha-glucosidase/alpha-galactosidase [Chloroflexota bacterium]
MANITLIGAGSISFSLSLIMDLWLTRSLWGSTITLMDISQERLDLLATLARRYVKESGIDLAFKTTSDRRDSLRGADYVICAVKIGGYDPLEMERKIAEKHGYYRGIGDRVSCYHGGVGAYHQLQFFLGLAKDMQEMCPGAYLIQTANPVFEGTNAVVRRSNIRAVGVCHGHFHYRDLARLLGVPPEEVAYTVAGVNHCVWLTHFSFKGKSLYPALDEWIEKDAAEFWRSEKYMNPKASWECEQMSPAAVEMYRYYGVFPIGDAVRSAAPWWFHKDLQTKQRWYGPMGGFDSEIGWTEYLTEKKDTLRRYTDWASDETRQLSHVLPLKKSGEQHIPLIDALENDQESDFELNILNNGAVEGIPDDVLVEVPAVVSSQGIRAVHV